VEPTTDTVLVEIVIDGPEYSDLDLQEAREYLGRIGAVRATGAWGPAAEPTHVEFFLKAVAGGVATGIGVQIGKQLWDVAWPALSEFLANRLKRVSRPPDIKRVVIAVDALEIVFHWPSDDFLEQEQGEFLFRVYEQLTTGGLADCAVQQIVLPVVEDEYGMKVSRWREYEGAFPTRFWSVRTRDAEPGTGYYDSERGNWV